MGLSRFEEDGIWVVEGEAGEPLLARAEDAALVVGACVSVRTNLALLYAANLPAHFFDLSSGEAGAVVDKLRRYGISLAVVCDAALFSSRFHEFVADDFKVFADRPSAWTWLARR